MGRSKNSGESCVTDHLREHALGEVPVELQDEAISMATELGMKPLLERVLAKREILEA